MERVDPREDVRAVKAARKVLLELHQLLGEFRNAMTVVGGSAPPLLLQDDPENPYVGTTDVDIVLDPQAVPEDVHSAAFRPKDSVASSRKWPRPLVVVARRGLSNQIQTTI